MTTSRSSLLLGAGPQAVVSTADAVFAPLAARQVARATQFDAQTSRNDTTLSVAVAYFNVQQARGELTGALDSLRRASDLVRRVEKLAEGLTPGVEKNRALSEQARRRQAVELAYEGCGRAMVQSWGVIGLGLSVFALSSFIPTFRFGALMIGLLTVGLVGNLVFLPALLAGPLGRWVASHVRNLPAETPAIGLSQGPHALAPNPGRRLKATTS